jgi:hypothetical protein
MAMYLTRVKETWSMIPNAHTHLATFLKPLDHYHQKTGPRFDTGLDLDSPGFASSNTSLPLFYALTEFYHFTALKAGVFARRSVVLAGTLNAKNWGLLR